MDEHFRLLLAVPQGFHCAQPGYVLPFQYEPRRFVFVLKNLFGCGCVRLPVTLSHTANAGSVQQLLLYQQSLLWQFLFPGLPSRRLSQVKRYFSFNRVRRLSLTASVSIAKYSLTITALDQHGCHYPYLALHQHIKQACRKLH